MNGFETKIEGVNPDQQETKIESEDVSGLEELVKKFTELNEEYEGRAAKFGGDELQEKIEMEKERLIGEPESFSKLYSVLDRIQKLNQINPNLGSLVREPTEKASLKIYNITELKEVIGKVETRELDASYVTRVGGLRNKVEELSASK